MLRLKGVPICKRMSINRDGPNCFLDAILLFRGIVFRIPLLQSRSTDATKHEIHHASPPTIFFVPAAVAGVLMLELGLEEDE